MEPTTVETTPAPAAAAAADPEVFEAILPEDLELPPDVDPDAPPAAEEPPAAPTPESVVTPPADSSPAPAPVATTPMPPGLRKERDKAKRYRDAWESEKARADALATRPEAPIFVPLPAERRAALRKKAEEGSMGDVFDAITDGFTEMLRGGHQQREQQTREQAEEQLLEEQRQRVNEMENDFKSKHPDFTTTLARGGIWALLNFDEATKRYTHPQGAYWARIVHAAPNPVAKAYDLALGAIAAKGGELPPDPEQTPVATTPAATTTPPPAAPVAATTPTPAGTPAEAERRGAQRVVDAVVKNQARSVGTRGLPNAGPPQRRGIYDRGYLTRLQNTDFDAYRRLCDANPAHDGLLSLEAFHQGWGSSAA